MRSLPAHRLLLTVAAVLAFASASQASGWRLLRDGKPLSVISVRKDGDGVYAAIGEMARLLGFSACRLNDGLLIQRGAARLQVIPNAAAVWLGYEIIPLKKKAFMDGGRWWMDAPSAVMIMEKLLSKAGEPSSLSWDKEGESEPPPVPVLEENLPEPAAEGPPASFSARWGVHDDRIRLVVQSEGPIPVRPMNDGVELTFPGPQKIDLSPDPAISLRAANSGGKWVLSVFAGGWTVKVFELSSPHRVVADFFRPAGVPPEPTVTKIEPEPRPKPEKKPEPLRKPRPLVVVDAGHGGKDPGAAGSGYREKDLALQIARRLAKNVKALGLDAKLTREDDRYLLLKARTELANKWDADAFVSIHLNALPKGRHAKGVEIYIMALPTDKDAMELAKIENAELVEGAADKEDEKTNLLLSILGDMQQNNKITESTLFAEAIFTAGKKGGLPMRRVAQAPFFVLRGAAMPAVLVETGFISEKSEVKMLADPGYQERLAKSLAQGIVKYLK